MSVLSDGAGNSIWSGEFWKATGERAVTTAAQAAILALGADVIDQGGFNVMETDWLGVLGFAAGGAVLAVLKALGVNAVTKTGPSFSKAEVVVPEGVVVTGSEGPGVSDVPDGPLGPSPSEAAEADEAVPRRANTTGPDADHRSDWA